MNIFDFTSRRNPRKGDRTLAYIGEPKDIRDYPAHTTCVVLGQLVIMNLNVPPQESSQTFVPQPTRTSHRNDFSLSALRHPPTVLYADIHPLLAEYIETGDRHNGVRVVLASDAMMTLARKQGRNSTLLICNGYEAPDTTYFDTYLFHNGQLIHITESLIKPATHPRYGIDVRQHLDEALAEYPDARILWTAPLSAVDIPGYVLEPFGSEIYHHKFHPVTHDGKTAPPSPKIPAIATAATLALCVGTGAFDLATLGQTRATYDRLTSETRENTTLALEILQARADWQRETSSNSSEVVLGPANRLLAAVAQNPEWRLRSLSTKTQRGSETATPAIPKGNEASSLSVILSTSLLPNTSPTDQAQPIVATLSQKTGTQLIVRQQGITTTTDSGHLLITIDADNP